MGDVAHEHESNKRSMMKTMTWRIIATVTTILMVFIFTKEWVVALEVGALETVSKFILYYVHERMWDHSEWGKVMVEVK